MVKSTWCIKANSEEEAKVLFPFFNRESTKYGLNWCFTVYQKTHRDYYVYSDNKDIFYDSKQPKGYKLYSFNSFVNKFINKNVLPIYELW